MIVSEMEAKGMWCPFSRVIEGDGSSLVAGNRAVESANGPWISDRHMCLGSGCMAWRETYMSHGYCGLAGKPEH